MESKMATIAERYSYPLVFDRVINDFIKICESVFCSKKLGILLVGSSARGEFCWSGNIDAPVFYSDIEFIVVIDRADLKFKKNFHDEIRKLNSSLSFGVRFKVDYVINTWSDLKKADKKIFIFDSKNKGIDLSCNSVVSVLPDVTINNINFSELNDILLHRMKAVIADIPEDVFTSEEISPELCMSISKNSLDSTTWLFPYEAEKLLSGFKERLEVWKAKKNQLNIFDFFDDSQLLFLINCDAMRSRAAPLRKDVELLNQYIELYNRALAYCKARNNIGIDVNIDSPNASRKIFWEYNPRRRLKEAYLILRNFKSFGYRNIFRNIFLPRKGRQVSFCFSMIKALAAHMNGNEGIFAAEVDASHEKLKLIMNVQITGEDPVSKWQNLRKSYLSINSVFI